MPGIEFEGRPRAIPDATWAHVAQLAERILGKDKVPGSTPGVGSREPGGGTTIPAPLRTQQKERS